MKTAYPHGLISGFGPVWLNAFFWLGFWFNQLWYRTPISVATIAAMALQAIVTIAITIITSFRRASKPSPYSS